MPKDLAVASNNTLGIRNGQVDPLLLMGPGCQITQDLTLSTAALSIKHTSCVVAFEALEADSSNILWAP